MEMLITAICCRASVAVILSDTMSPQVPMRHDELYYFIKHPAQTR